MNVLNEKLKEVFVSVFPITIIVFILHFTIAPVELYQLLRFIIGAVLIFFGLSVFLLGVDIGVSQIGHLMGSFLVKSNKVLIVGVIGLILGFFISIAEPDLHVLANQVDLVTSGTISKTSILVIVSIGIAVLMTIGLFRIIFNISLQKVFIGMYSLVLIFSLFSLPEYLAIGFDASGATTGAMTVPFILALAVGVSSLKKNGITSEEDSFGLVGITSIGPILSIVLVGLFLKQNKLSEVAVNQMSLSSSVLYPFIQKLPIIMSEIMLAILPLLVVFILYKLIVKDLSKRAFIRILKGLIYAYFGLVIFLLGVNAGFMEVGYIIGYKVASLNGQWIIVIVGFILGLVTVLAEPAVHVLTEQIEDITSGYVQKRIINIALSTGVGFAVALSMLRIVIPGIQLWHYLLPGFSAALLMTFFVPNLFIGIAFDSGGVASGPMTATFILAFSQGAASATQSANVLIDGFGMIAMVALTPLIALQIIGFIYKRKSGKRGI
ncbi:MAG TPA: DUF1538 domain-containing protein [Atribacter sp.]|uniref:DUF1538 domain-containing protein n=1 Tax=Atribacter sp. TaxID=2847780 RepID=UPI0017655FDC|nr:DUF1538 domain-containing protein [Atribacter sp.]MDI9593864.1 DUF1538 domain-containing protein [Atribacterota bacterium]HHT11037.1 DUF1538 domain-containing protein [Candidatus Atribacteria bacterium]HQK82791.1 DUF1538 domain-containing protein [Atribacter sp.]